MVDTAHDAPPAADRHRQTVNGAATGRPARLFEETALLHGLQLRSGIMLTPFD